jgi:hypothetical protein
MAIGTPDWLRFTYISDTGAGRDNGIGHDKNPLIFPYVSEIFRSHYLQPPPNESCHTYDAEQAAACQEPSP